MALETFLFMEDKLHSSVTTSTITADTSTEAGYNRDLVRETDYSLSWKPDDGASDQYIQADLGSTSALGANPAIAYVVIAYDARGADQVSVTISADDTGAAFTNRATFTLNKTEPCCDVTSWLVPATADRYFRLEQLNADRGGGTKTAKIYGWSLFNADDVLTFGAASADFPSDTTGPGMLNQSGMSSGITVMTRQRMANRVARSQQEVELTFAPASMTLWEELRDRFHNIYGSSRPIYMQFDGLRNPAHADFAMARLLGGRLSGFRSERDVYEMSLRFIAGTTFGSSDQEADSSGLMMFDDEIFTI